MKQSNSLSELKNSGLDRFPNKKYNKRKTVRNKNNNGFIFRTKQYNSSYDLHDNAQCHRFFSYSESLKADQRG